MALLELLGAMIGFVMVYADAIFAYIMMAAMLIGLFLFGMIIVETLKS